MSADNNAFPALKTVKNWNESTGVDARSLFKGLSQALVTLGKSEWDEIVTSLTGEIYTSARTADAPGQAWAFIWINLVEIMFELTRELLLWLSWTAPEDSGKIIDGLDCSFENENLAIMPSTFASPDKIELLEWIKDPFEKWLTGQGLESGRARPALERLNTYYKAAFFRNLLKTEQTLKAPMVFLNPDNDPGKLMNLHWAAYCAELEKQTRKPYLAEDTFDISQVYIPLRAYRLRPVLEGEDFVELDEYLRRKNKGRVKKVVDLEKALTDWINKPEYVEKVCLIASSPGAGEGTFNRRLADGIARSDGARPLLIPLNNWDETADPENELERFLVDSGRFPLNPILESKDDFVLIFEKLGALSVKLYDLADRIKLFMSQLSRLLALYNRDGRRVIAIVTGFAAVIRIVESFFISKEQFQGNIPVYHILPFIVTADKRSDYYDPERLLEEDQRGRWWRLYGRATGGDYGGVPDELVNLSDNFVRLTANPTYNYMAANSWEQNRIVMSDKTTRSELAFDRLMLTYDRVYNPKKPYKWLFELTPSQYRSVIKEIAVMCWHSGDKIVRLDRASERIERSGLGQQLKAITELAKTGVLSFLYYEAGPDRKGRLVFPYRGLLNYLTARRIFNELQVLEKELEQRSAFAFMGMDDEAALRRWAALCGPARFNHQILHFFIDIIQVEAAESAGAFQEMAVRLLNWIARYGLPLNDLGGASNVIAAWARNAEEALLICHYACALTAMKRGEIDWPNKTAAGGWIRRLIGQRMKGVFHLTLHCLEYMDFSSCLLDGIDLRDGNLNHSSFKKSSLNFACLANADLKDADLTGASLCESNLNGANLKRAYMRKTDIRQSKLKWANLQQADLSGSILVETVFRGADLRWADLRGADLRKADLRGCDLRWAYLEDADMRGADLRGADLRETELARVRLDGADLTWADLDHTALTGRTN